MEKEKKQFDFLEDFLHDNQDVFLKNFKKNSEDERWAENVYKPLIDKNSEVFQDEDEGQLAIDVYQDKNNIIVLSAIAGIDPDKLDISLHNDILTIRGERAMDNEIDNENYFYKECYWGKFSRSVILPVEVRGDKINATIKGGILKVVLPKVNPTKKIKVKVLDED